jgi:pimeloyl-ACP methyl ester carboxylesterase
MAFLTLAGRRIEVERYGAPAPGRPTLVFLHEGLGSVAMWRDFPARAAAATGRAAVAYSRHGYGRSEPLSAPHTVRYMHDEAEGALPELLARLAIERPVLVGHSDGASIALIHAGSAPQGPAGLVLLAPHVFVEQVTLASIAAARVAYEASDLRERLARYHADADSAFWGWNRIWLHPDFARWNIEEVLPRVACPVLVIQGKDDEYGTAEQHRRMALAVADLEVLELDRCRHSPHRDRPEAVLEALAAFVARLRP